MVGPNVECHHLRVKNSKPEIEETMKMLAVELTGDELDLKRRKTELRALARMCGS